MTSTSSPSSTTKKGSSSSYYVCLYSKYSDRCTEFLDLLSTEGMMERTEVKMVCIDNVEVRKLILEDSLGYKIRLVPCVLEICPSGRIEKHEASDALVWLRKYKESTTMRTTALSNATISPSSSVPRPNVTHENEIINPPDGKGVSEEKTTTAVPTRQEKPYHTTMVPISSTPTSPSHEEHRSDSFDISSSTASVPLEKTMATTPEEMVSTAIKKSSTENIKEMAMMMAKQREEEDRKLRAPSASPSSRTQW